MIISLCITATPKSPIMVIRELIHVNLKLRQILASPLLYPQHLDLMGSKVQKLNTGVSMRAGWEIKVDVAFLTPRERQRVPNA